VAAAVALVVILKETMVDMVAVVWLSSDTKTLYNKV
jgi:hypothetical protein